MRKLLGQTIVCLALLLPTAVQAVVFDFDGVCGSPPCVIREPLSDDVAVLIRVRRRDLHPLDPLGGTPRRGGVTGIVGDEQLPTCGLRGSVGRGGNRCT